MYLISIALKLSHTVYFACAINLCHWSPCAHEPLKTLIRHRSLNKKTEIKYQKEFCYQFQGRPFPFRETIAVLSLQTPLHSSVKPWQSYGLPQSAPSASDFAPGRMHPLGTGTAAHCNLFLVPKFCFSPWPTLP